MAVASAGLVAPLQRGARGCQRRWLVCGMIAGALALLAAVGLLPSTTHADFDNPRRMTAKPCHGPKRGADSSSFRSQVAVLTSQGGRLPASEAQKRMSWEQRSGTSNHYMFARHSPLTDKRLAKSSLGGKSGLLEAAVPLQLPNRHAPIAVARPVEKVPERENRHSRARFADLRRWNSARWLNLGAELTSSQAPAAPLRAPRL